MKMPDFLAKDPPVGGEVSADAPSPVRARRSGLAFWRTWSAREKLAAVWLMVVPLVVYWPCLRGDYVWDDGSWVQMLFPRLGNLRGLWLLWTNTVELQQYYPVTGTTFWLDYNLWGFHPTMYHVENVLGHGVAAILFWRFLRRLRMPGCFLAGAILAVHPVMVESVAWITERKNILSLIFYLAALLAYGSFADYWRAEGDAMGRRNWKAYGLAGVWFVLALLSKITAFSFPAVVLLICWWKRGKPRWQRDILPTVPFFAVAIGLGYYISWLEKFHVGAIGRDWALTFPERCLVAGRALWFYAGKILWPANLCFIYPHWQLNVASVAQWLYPAAALLALAVLWFGRNKIGRGPVVVALMFAGSLFPVLGFMNAYYMRFSFVCNHLVYVSSLCLIAPTAMLVARGAERFHTPAMLKLFAAVSLPILAIISWSESGMFKNVEVLYRTTLARNPNAEMPRLNLARLMAEENKFNEAIDYFQQAIALEPDDAISHNDLGETYLEVTNLDLAMGELRKAIALQPDYANAHFNLGDAYFRQGRLDDAESEFKEAVKDDPHFAQAYNDLGTIYDRRHQTDDALAAYEKAVRADPDDLRWQSNLGQLLLALGRTGEAEVYLRKAVELGPDAPVPCNNLAIALLQDGQVDEAIGLLERALKSDPNYANAHYNLGDALGRKGDLAGAVTNYQRAIELQPDFAAAHHGLGVVYFRQQNAAGALAEFQRAVDLQPENAEANSTMAWFLASCPDADFRDGARAVHYAQHAQQLTRGRDPGVLATLAAAYATAGQLSDAIATASKGLDLATAQGDTAMAEKLKQQLERYDSNGAAHPPE
jgi:protein O-mannosyl-transferase